MSTPKPETRLAEQAEALTLYLEALLVEKPAFLPVPLNAPPAPAVTTGRVIDLIATTLPPVVVAPVVAPAEVVAPPVTQVQAPDPGSVAVPRPATQTGMASEPARPDWAQEPFPCLILKVQGLSLALPLVKLNRILAWSEPTPIPGYASWLLGMLQQGPGTGKNLKVVDTAAFVMPERQVSVDPANPAGETPRHIVMIGDGEWGLTCDDVSNVISIDPGKVRWRSNRSKRPWLAGTVIEQLCALLDAEHLAEMLSAGAPGMPS